MTDGIVKEESRSAIVEAAREALIASVKEENSMRFGNRVSTARSWDKTGFKDRNLDDRWKAFLAGWLAANKHYHNEQ